MLPLPRFSRSFDLEDSSELFTNLVPKNFFSQSELSTMLSFPTIADNKFNLALNLSKFGPSDIQIKMDDDKLQVSGKYEKQDEGIYEYRSYVQRFSVPENIQADRMKCQLDEQTGMLQIEAPLSKTLAELTKNDNNQEHNISIEFADGVKSKQFTDL